MKAPSLVVATLLFAAGSGSASAAGHAFASHNTIIEGLMGISGALKVHPGTVAEVARNLAPIGQDALAGTLNAAAELPGLAALGGRKGSNNPLVGIQEIPAVGSNVAVALKELPTYIPSVAKNTLPSVLHEFKHKH